MKLICLILYFFFLFFFFFSLQFSHARVQLLLIYTLQPYRHPHVRNGETRSSP